MTISPPNLTAMARAVTALRTIRRSTLKPTPRRNLIEWADEFRRLSARAAAQPGRWRTATVPMALGPTAAVTDPRVRFVSVMAPTQEFKTELINNAAGYYAHQDASPILLVLPTVNLAESYTKDRLDPLVDETPALAAIAPPKKSRSPDRTLDRLAFETGAVIDIVGANSPTDLASRPKRIVLADEIDKYPPSAGKEGDPLALAEERQSTFWNAKSIRACSPTQKGFSRIGREYEMSDQRRLFVKCPHCDEAQPLTFDRVRWDKDENGQHMPETAGVVCKGCGTIWTEAERRKAIQAVALEPDFGWRQTKPFRCCGEDHKPLNWTDGGHWNEHGEACCPKCSKPGVPVRHAGFNASKLYSLTQSLEQTVRKFLSSKDDLSLLQVFTNTQLAELWEESGTAVDPESLLARREAYGPDNIPSGALVLTAGVDVQDNRLECEIVGWGAGRENWGVEYHVIHGDPSQDQVWHELDQILLRSYRRDDGALMRIQAACIDSGGHHTERVYAFTKPRFGRRVYAIKGDGGPAKPIWPKRASKSKTRQVLFMVGTNAASDQIYGDLRVKRPGAGYCHFAANYDQAWFTQLLAERLVRKRVNGQDVRVYECPKGTRNEAHDCRRYALAALHALPRQLPPGSIPVSEPQPTQEAPEVEQAPQPAPAKALC